MYCAKNKIVKINIDGSDDPFYRYKMRQLNINVLGKGKMIKTMLINVDDVASDLHLDPILIVKFLGYELNTKSSYEPKKSKMEKAYLSGNIDENDISTAMEKMINAIVLCKICGLPELEKTSVCRSCGMKNILNIDPRLEKYYLGLKSGHGDI